MWLVIYKILTFPFCKVSVVAVDVCVGVSCVLTFQVCCRVEVCRVL